MKFIVIIFSVCAVILAISKMPQRDEADKYEPQCVAMTGEVAIKNKDGLCEIHAKLNYAQANEPSAKFLACPVRGGCNLWSDQK